MSLFENDVATKYKIVEELHNNLFIQAKRIMAQNPTLNILVLCNDHRDADQNLDNFAVLEINDMDSLKRLKNLGAKISTSNNPGKEIDKLDFIKNRQNEKIRCLLYTPDKNIPFDFYIYYYLLNIIKCFYCNDYYIYNNRMIFIFSDISEGKNHRTQYLVLAGGAGDVFIFLPILYNLHIKEKYKFIILHKNMYNVLCTLGFHDMIEFIYVPAIWSLLIDEQRRPFKNIKKGFILSIFSKDNEQDKKSRFEVFCDYYKEMEMLPNISYKTVFENFRRKFPHKWINPENSKIKIAVQRISSSKDENGNTIKEWPKGEMRRLINYCRSNDIDLINVCPHDDMRNEYPLDQGDRTFEELWELLCEIDLFIGIDSSIGHMCALTGTPNLNLYFSKSKEINFNNRTCMPLSMSYTLFTKDEYPKSEHVIREMNNILFDGKWLSSEFIPLTERMEGMHYKFI